MLDDRDSARGLKAYKTGTHRMVFPEETLRRVAPLLAPAGITRIANLTGLDRTGIPVVSVMRPNARSLSVSQGKGITLAAAKASGVMEALESFHAETIDHPLRLASHRDMLARGYRVADIGGLAFIRDGRFHPNLPLLWIEGRDLVSGEATWLPYETVHASYILPLPAGSGCFVASTNGLASGNGMDEATSHAMAEVIERDANTLWNHASDEARSLSRIDLASIDSEACRALVDRLVQAELDIGIWDITSDTGVPAFYCLIVDRRIELAHSGAGAGAHPSREVALLRALTEAVQVRVNYIAGARDDLNPEEYSEEGIGAKLDFARRLMALRNGAGKDWRRIATHEFDSFGEDIGWMTERLRAVGVEQIIAVDLTKPAFGLPVVRVVIPGLEGPDDHDDYCMGPRLLARREPP
ncbi:YcaO-like family protein [Nordella sp. HKS 07]|uniref:YcaO-like family protein n=1 Tax=Nordella sp. HKS 07 TaxID=2712222 RepID=UPI0013E1E36A|nr:YcaO-like family protein [Nordella sp. HKS 07]QIG47691.1 YcaO-like family protein [Nordella sp. HKS 07]